MKKKMRALPLLILPLTTGCKSEVLQGNFYIGSVENKIVELSLSDFSAKVDSEKGTFFLATHAGDSCTCWTGFQYIIESYNNERKASNKEYLPFYSFDTELMTSDLDESFKVDKILSGYVELYVFVDGEVVQKYSKNAKKDLDIFENVSKFSSVISKYVKTEPLKNYSYVSYEYVRDNLINKDKDFVLMVVRSGCKDCNYSIPNTVTPYMLEHSNLKVPVYVCDIQGHLNKEDYNTVKETLCLTVESSPFGYKTGVVPTYQYWQSGVLKDAGVYANDSFAMNSELNKVQVTSTYFDGTRELQYTNKNLLEEMNNEDSLDVIYLNTKDTYYMDIKKAADYHDPLIKDFLSYYCLNK